jgi:hypothetical protein
VSGDDNGWRPDGQPAGGWIGLWLVAAAVGVHIIEEYAVNFVGWSHTALHAPVTWQDFHLVNGGVILYCVACAVIGARLPVVSLSSAALVILNAVGFHAGSSLLTATALLLFVPSGAFAYWEARAAGALSGRVLLGSAAIGVLWHAFLGGVFWLRYFAPLYP